MAKKAAGSAEHVYFEDKIGDVLKQISLREVLQHLFPSRMVQYRKSFPCPFHSDSSPSGWLFQTNRGDEFKCFGTCNLPRGGGNVIHIVKYLKSVNDVGALDWLAQEGFLDLKLIDGISKDLKEYQATTEFVEAMYEACNNLLLTKATKAASDGYDWLVNQRKIEPMILPDFGVGVYDRAYLEQRFTKEKLYQFDMIAEGQFVESIIYFYHLSPNTISHRVKIRKIGGTSRDTEFLGPSKYQREIGTFGLNRMQNIGNPGAAKSIYLLEGETDVLQLQSAACRGFSNIGYLNVVSRSGTSGLNDFMIKSMNDIGIEAIRLFPDNDHAGIEMIKSALKLKSPIPLAVTWPDDYMPGQDPDTYFKDKFAVAGVAGIQQAVTHIVNKQELLATWLAKRLLEEWKAKPSDPILLQKTRAGLVEAAAKTGLDGIDFNDYAKEIAKSMPDLDKHTLEHEIKKHKAGNRKEFNANNEKIRRFFDAYEIAKITKVQGEPQLEWKPLLNATITVVQNVMKSDGELAYKDVIVRHCGREVKAHIYPDQLADVRLFIQAIDKTFPSMLDWSDDFKRMHMQVLNQDNYGAPVAHAFDVFGYRDKTLEYLSPSLIIHEGKVLPNEKYISHIDENQPCALYDFIPVDEALAVAKVNEAIKLIFYHLINIHVRSVTLPTLAFTAGTFLDGLIGRKHNNYILALMGRYSSGKSRTAQAFLNFACDAMPGDGRNCLAITSTFNASEKSLYHISDSPGLVDDLKSAHFRIPALRQNLLSLIQNHFDRKGKARLTKTLDFRQSYPSKCGLILTGEAIPTSEGSMASRMLNVNVPSGGYNIQQSRDFEAGRDLLRMFTPYYIAYTQRLQKLPDPNTFFPGFGDSDRAYFCARKIGCGLRVLLDFCLQWPKSPLSQKTADDVWNQFLGLLPGIVEDNIQSTREVDDEHKFLNTLAQMVQAGEVAYDDASGHAPKVGYVDGATLVIFPDIAITQVRKNCSVDFDKHQLFKNLREMGFIVDSQPAKPSAAVKAQISHRSKCWVFDKVKFEDLFQHRGLGGSQTI